MDPSNQEWTIKDGLVQEWVGFGVPCRHEFRWGGCCRLLVSHTSHQAAGHTQQHYQAQDLNKLYTMFKSRDVILTKSSNPQSVPTYSFFDLIMIPIFEPMHLSISSKEEYVCQIGVYVTVMYREGEACSRLLQDPPFRPLGPWFKDRPRLDTGA